MNSILAQVTPLTKAVIWATHEQIDSETTCFREIDYLLNGLLTATLKNAYTSDGNVLVSENFGKNLFVYVGPLRGEKNLISFFDLIAGQLQQESTIIFIDDINKYDQFLKLAPLEIKNKIQLAK
jgi:hypothetical protein